MYSVEYDAIVKVLCTYSSKRDEIYWRFRVRL